jgi:ubiquitin-protein ligase
MESSGSGLWSSFHSSLAQAVRGPGTPQRQQMTGQDTSDELTSGRAVDLAGQFTELDLLIEYKLLCLNCPSGVYVLPSSKSLYEWHGVLFIHSGPFREGIFKFTLYIPDRFPDQRPMVRFQSKVYHPYIHTDNGTVNMLRVFPGWDRTQHHIWNVVCSVKDSFYRPETWEGCDSASFSAQAQACSLISLRHLHTTAEDSDDGNLIRFPEVDEQKFRLARHLLNQGQFPTPPPPSTTGVLDTVRQFWDQLVSR